MIGPVGDTMVQTTQLCDGDGLLEPDHPCPGWATHGGMEVRCWNPIHEQRTVTTEAVCLQAGVSYRKVDYWIRHGYLRCDDPRPGTGYTRLLPESEVSVARLMGRLVDGGVLPHRAAVLARHLWDGRPAQVTPQTRLVWGREEDDRERA